jgi:hypothetical protein
MDTYGLLEDLGSLIKLLIHLMVLIGPHLHQLYFQAIVNLSHGMGLYGSLEVKVQIHWAIHMMEVDGHRQLPVFLQLIVMLSHGMDFYGSLEVKVQIH